MISKLKMYRILHLLLIILLFIILFSSCAKNGDIVTNYPSYEDKKIPQKLKRKTIPRMGHTIQVGAFSNLNNAVRLTNKLNEQGFDAIYFAENGFFKVRFGNFITKTAAKKRAQNLKNKGIIEEFYIVAPEEYSITKGYSDESLRDELVKTANSFIGVSYLWGGASVETGFDCSGLTMTIYQLNGLNLPHSSRDQFELGYKVKNDSILKGDLLFFATSGNGKVSHVGIYVGNGKFIHAPCRGKKIRMESLSSNYYKKRFLGARSYM